MDKSNSASNPLADLVAALGTVLLGGTAIGGCGFVVLMLVVVRPLLLIWALNGLMGTKIQFTAWNVIYAWVVCMALGGSGCSPSSGDSQNA